MQPFQTKHQPLLLVKLGGSVITHKKRAGHLATHRLQELVNVLSEWHGPMILVHGTGSFGKPAAVEHGFLDGRISQDKLHLVVKVQEQLLNFHARVMTEMQRAGISVCSMPAHALFVCSEGSISYGAKRPVAEAVARGMVPVLYGNVVTDEQDDFRVLSSDDIMVWLAREFPIERVLFLSDVDGVYSDHPEVAGSQVLREISSDYSLRIEREEGDVSGGMFNKLGAAFQIAQLGILVSIHNGKKPDTVRAALWNRDALGTVIRCKGEG